MVSNFRIPMHEFSSNVAVHLEQHFQFFGIQLGAASSFLHHLFLHDLIEFIIFLRGADEFGAEQLFGADFMHCLIFVFRLSVISCMVIVYWSGSYYVLPMMC